MCVCVCALGIKYFERMLVCYFIAMLWPRPMS